MNPNLVRFVLMIPIVSSKFSICVVLSFYDYGFIQGLWLWFYSVFFNVMHFLLGYVCLHKFVNCFFIHVCLHGILLSSSSSSQGKRISFSHIYFFISYMYEIEECKTWLYPHFDLSPIDPILTHCPSNPPKVDPWSDLTQIWPAYQLDPNLNQNPTWPKIYLWSSLTQAWLVTGVLDQSKPDPHPYLQPNLT